MFSLVQRILGTRIMNILALSVRIDMVSSRMEIEQMAEHIHLFNSTRVAIIETKNDTKGMSGFSSAKDSFFASIPQ